VAELTAKQAAILAAAASLVKTGGRLVYATCSLLTEENEAIVEAFLAGHHDFRLVPAGDCSPPSAIPLEMGRYLRLDPVRHGTDGFFAAVLERSRLSKLRLLLLPRCWRGRYWPAPPLELACPRGTAQVAFTPGDDAGALVVEAIRKARKQVLVQTYSFTHKDIAQGPGGGRNGGAWTCR
jgi:hypothetical protein